MHQSAVRIPIRMLRLLLLGVQSLCILGCGDTHEGREVVVYVSVDQAVAEPVLRRFTDETGVVVRPLFDTEATKTTGLANRIRRESDRPRADVFWSSEPFAVHQLGVEGLLEVLPPELWDAHPAAWRDPGRRWLGFAARARVLAFDPARIDASELPTSWADLASPRWADQIAIADPRFGTTRGHLGALRSGWGTDVFQGWVEGLADNRVRVLPGGNAATVDAVSRGEVLLGLTDTDDVRAARERGLTIDAVMLDHEPSRAEFGGTLVIPNSAGMIAGSARSEAATAFLRYLVSEEVERLLRDSTSGNLPVVHPSLRSAGNAAIGRAWDVPIPKISLDMDEAVDHAMNAWKGS